MCPSRLYRRCNQHGCLTSKMFMAIDNQQSGTIGKLTASDIAWVLFVVFIGLTARLLHIDSQPFWLDEALTYQRIHLGLDGLITDSFSNRHMPS